MDMKEASARHVVRRKQTELGLIPEDWDVVSVGSIASFRSGDGIAVSELRQQSSDTPIPVYGGNGIAGYTIRPVTHDQTIVVGRVGQKCGEVYLTPGPAWISDNALFPRCFNTDVDIRFLALALKKAGLNDLRNRNDLPLVTQSILHSVRIPLPRSKAEQQAIAEALADANAFIDSLEQLLVKKRQLKTGAMQELLTGKTRLQGFKGKWDAKTLSELFAFSGGLSASRDQLSTRGHCYLHYGDIHLSSKSFVDVRVEFQSIPKLQVPLKKVPAASLLADGDVVFVDASEDDEGASKHVVIINPDNTPFISGLHTIVAKSRTADLDHLYRRYCFQTRAVKHQIRFFAVGTKVSGISKANLAKVTISLPPIDEQSAIAAVLSDMDADIVALGEKLAKACQLKQGMMQELLTGTIRLA